ncbi:MAG: nucleotide exchange factor GrpE [Pseudomonadota bacterium]
MAKDKDQMDGKDEEMFLDDPEALEEALDEDEPSHEEIEIDALRAERDEMKDRLLRALAEAENIRKRAERDRRDAELYGGVKLARDLLSVHDNLGRALEAIDDDLRAGAPGLVEGLELTQKDLLAAFQKHKIEKVTPEVGDRFDPKLHQAMFEAPIPEHAAGEIIQVMATGFVIGERLLRPAQVGVSSTPPGQHKPAAPEAEEG